MIKSGSKVSLHYVLTVDGKVVDSTEGKDPLVYLHGHGDLIPGFEDTLEGMKVGDKKQFQVNPDKGYGTHDPAAIEKVPLEHFEEGHDLEKGQQITGTVGDKEFHATVMEILEDHVLLDLNHPLAGKDLNFEVEIVSID